MDPEVSELQVTREKSTILHMASRLGNEEWTEQIFRSHPSLVHEINMNGDTPLHIAARSGHLGVAKLLIDRAKKEVVESGMHPLRMVNKKKLTVLQEAVRNDHYSVVDLLIKEDPGLTCTTVDGVESPLFMAVEGRFYQIADRILETFPNCALSGRRGMTIMHAAVIGLPNDDTVLNPLSVFFNTCWATFNRRIKGKRGKDEFDHNSLQFVDKVLEKIGLQILEEKDEFGWIPLHYAAYIGNREVVKRFLETNSSLAYIKNKQGMSALHISAQEGCIGVIDILMEKCPDVCELLDNKDQTALHVAARNGNLDVLQTLLGMTCFEDLINKPDKEGNTLLHVAARHSDSSILMILADDRRINKTVINNLGMTAGDILRSSEQLCIHKKVFGTIELRIDIFPKNLEGRVSEEIRMEQLNREKEHEISEDTEINEFTKNDNAAAREKDTSTTTAYLNKAVINNLGMNAGDIVRSSEQICKLKKIFPKSLERRVSEETRIEQLNREKENETSENTVLEVFAQDDKAAGRAIGISITTAYLTKQDDSYESEKVKNAATVNLLVATIITSVTFAAFVSMPGGYDDKTGMPILREMDTFRFFMVTNSLAFGMAVSSMFIHFLCSALPFFRVRYPTFLVAIVTEGSILFALGAFIGIVIAVFPGQKKIIHYKTTLLPTGINIIILSSFLIPIIGFVFYQWIKWLRRKEKKK